jgi:Tol biopolymer transport system component
MDEWDEHAQVSPSGKKIVWMTSKGYKLPDNPNHVQTDFWMMNLDGSEKKRLTFFNEPGHAEYLGKTYAIAGDSSWNADGTCLAALVILDTQKGTACNYLIHFNSPQ